MRRSRDLRPAWAVRTEYSQWQYRHCDRAPTVRTGWSGDPGPAGGPSKLGQPLTTRLRRTICNAVGPKLLPSAATGGLAELRVIGSRRHAHRRGCARAVSGCAFSGTSPTAHIRTRIANKPLRSSFSTFFVIGYAAREPVKAPPQSPAPLLPPLGCHTPNMGSEAPPMPSVADSEPETAPVAGSASELPLDGSVVKVRLLQAGRLVLK